ncbi:runt-related transcription factor 2-like [Drosophila hydei]|uniref:Runt-related transcription factor 2-like n=1 Tax=Drosophila hydei TaxID=7224 RepID=A0A6J1M2M4_DROHY|nr:runt-related transcription factor 2-like [Drosophila hydei]XP_030079645.1 runt-related transcription factor 2-like [Drosophila hydei]
MAAKQQQQQGVRFPKAAAQISRQQDLNYCTQQQQQQQQQKEEAAVTATATATATARRTRCNAASANNCGKVCKRTIETR